LIEVDIDGTRYILPVTQEQLNELIPLVALRGGTIKPHVLRGLDSFETLKRKLQA
jgi:hypothetical protein